MRIHPIVSYTAGRIGLMAGVAVALFAVGFRSWALVILAVAVSMPLSWFLLRRQREQLAERIEAYSRRRRADRAALDEELDRALAAEEAAAAQAAEAAAAETDTAEGEQSDASRKHA